VERPQRSEDVRPGPVGVPGPSDWASPERTTQPAHTGDSAGRQAGKEGAQPGSARFLIGRA